MSYIDYRARATQAEQENARLREQLNKPQKYAGLQKTITEMLKLPADAPLNEIVRVVRYLRDNKELYDSSYLKIKKSLIPDVINVAKQNAIKSKGNFSIVEFLS